MLLNCLSCNAKYLLNSADLKPNGRTVQCAICGNEWFQEPNFDDQANESLDDSKAPLTEKVKLEDDMQPTSNLPSTYVKEVKPSLVNSIIVVLFFSIFIFLLFLLRRTEEGLFVLLFFYIQEFYFNLKLIINDLAQIIYHLRN